MGRTITSFKLAAIILPVSTLAITFPGVPRQVAGTREHGLTAAHRLDESRDR